MQSLSHSHASIPELTPFVVSRFIDSLNRDFVSNNDAMESHVILVLETLGIFYFYQDS